MQCRFSISSIVSALKVDEKKKRRKRNERRQYLVLADDSRLNFTDPNVALGLLTFEVINFAACISNKRDVTVIYDVPRLLANICIPISYKHFTCWMPARFADYVILIPSSPFVGFCSPGNSENRAQTPENMWTCLRSEFRSLVIHRTSIWYTGILCIRNT